MISPEQLERYRRMSPLERLAVWRDLTNAAFRLWEETLSPGERARRWAIWRREHDLSDQAMLRALHAAERRGVEQASERLGAPQAGQDAPGARGVAPEPQGGA